jgi:uncharacterized protein with HEPN domain
VTSRGDAVRLRDILASIDMIKRYAPNLVSDDLLTRDMAFDAVQYHLVVIGEAAGNIDAATLERAPDVPWHAIRRLRNVLAHEYFRVEVDLVRETVEGDDLVMLEHAMKALLA